MRFAATLDDAAEMIEVAGGDGRFRVTIGDHVWDVDARLSPPGSWSLLIDGVSYLARSRRRRTGSGSRRRRATRSGRGARRWAARASRS